MLRVDHVVHAVPDLDGAAQQYRDEFGLESVPGGRHLAWGTENRIVPLGPEYIELIAVADQERARENAFGRAVIGAAERGGALLTLCVATEDLDAVARRLDLVVFSGGRRRPDGITLRWRNDSAQLKVRL